MKALKAVLAVAVVCSAVFPASGQERKKADEAQPPKQSAPAKGSEAGQSRQQPGADAAVGAPSPAPSSPQSMFTERAEYLLGVGDVLQLKVYGEPQFDGDLVVEEDGNIAVPFADTPIPARCRKVNAVRKDVTEALAAFLKKPRVDLRVKERTSRRPAVVYGAVRTPSQYQMQRRARLLELLSNSGGVTEQHSGTIQIMHTEPAMCEEEDQGTQTAAAEVAQDALGLPFEIYRVADLRQGKPEANPYIRNGDIVYVAEASPIYIVGNVVQPMNLYLKEGMTLSRALATVGGVRDANESKVKIYRLNQQTMKQEELVVNYKEIKANKAKDIELQPFDIVEVPKKGFSTGDLIKMVTGMAQTGATSVTAGLGTRIIY
jgi:polysaccharide biosynthesis/export protein